MNTFSKNKYLFILIISAFLFIPFLGNVHLFDWDEINFAESAREMLVTGDYSKVQIAYKPFHEKPPLFIWMQALSMKIFGVNEFAARFPNAICGIITLLFLLKLGSNYFSQKFGLFWVLSFGGSILPFFYFKTGIIDPWFNLFIFSSIYFLLKNKLFISSILASLAVLTKGPVALILISLTFIIFYLYQRRSKEIIKLIPFLIISIIPYLIWYFIAYGFSKEILIEFIDYHLKLMSTEDAGHARPFYYHFVILLIGVFPASSLGFRELFKSNKDDFEFINLILLVVVLVIFSIVKTKIVHYSSLAYFPISLFSAKFLSRNLVLKRAYYFTGVFGLILGSAIALFPFIVDHFASNPGLIKDEFTKQVLSARVNWSIIDSIGGILFLISMIILLIKKKFIYSFFGTVLGFYFFLLLITPKIEIYTQRSNIDFWKSHANENVYLTTYSYKSYAHYFYGQIKPLPKLIELKNEEFQKYIFEEKIDHTAYFSVKSTKADKYLKEPDIELLFSKNGFSYFKKEKATK